MDGVPGFAHTQQMRGAIVRSPKSIPVLVVALLLISGCRQEEPLAKVRPVPKATDEGGWPLYEQPADGFALALPPGWTALNLDPKTLDRVLEQGVRINPDLKAMEQSIRQQAAAGMKFLGTEKASGGPGVTVMRSPLPGQASLDAVAADMVKQYEAMPSVERPVKRQRVRLKAGPAERVDFVIPVNPPGGGVTRLAMTSYALVRGQELYIVTVTAGAQEVAKYRPTFERIAQSFRFLAE
jgi:hypothetical protein